MSHLFECNWCKSMFIGVVNDVCPDCSCPATHDVGSELDAKWSMLGSTGKPLSGNSQDS